MDGKAAATAPTRIRPKAGAYMPEQELPYVFYPTVDRLREGFTESDYRRLADRPPRNERAATDRPLAVHLRLPASNARSAEACLDSLMRELDLQLPLLRSHIKVERMHVRGYSQGLFDGNHVRRLVRALRGHFDFLPDAQGDYLIDIDPGRTSLHGIRQLRELGFNWLHMKPAATQHPHRRPVGGRLGTNAQTVLIDDAIRVDKRPAEGSGGQMRAGRAACTEMDLLGLGPAALCHIGACFSQNASEEQAYHALLDAGHLPIVRGAELDQDDLLRRDLLCRLMGEGEVAMTPFARAWKIDFALYFKPEWPHLQALAMRGLLTLDGGKLAVTPAGQDAIGEIAAVFDRYLRE